MVVSSAFFFCPAFLKKNILSPVFDMDWYAEANFKRSDNKERLCIVFATMESSEMDVP